MDGTNQLVNPYAMFYGVSEPPPQQPPQAQDGSQPQQQPQAQDGSQPLQQGPPSDLPQVDHGSTMVQQQQAPGPGIPSMPSAAASNVATQEGVTAEAPVMNMQQQDPNAAAAFQGYPMLMQQYLIQQAQQQLLAAGMISMPQQQQQQAAMQQQQQQQYPAAFMNNWGAAVAANGDPNATPALNMMPGMGMLGADAYADQGYLGPWSVNSEMLMGRLGAAVMPPEMPKSGRRMRKKPKDRPKRPLSAYNLFFRDERQRLLLELPNKEADGDDDDEVNEDEKDQAEDAKDEAVEENSEKAPDEELTKRGHPVAPKIAKLSKKRPHGKIGFESLAKVIGQRWQALAPDDVAIYKAKAEEDMVRYKAEMETYLGRRAGGVNVNSNVPTGISVMGQSIPSLQAASKNEFTAAINDVEQPVTKKAKTNEAESAAEPAEPLDK